MGQFRILLTESISQAGIDLLKDCGEVLIAPDPSEETLIPLIQDCHALLIRSTKATANLMASAPNLKVIGRHGIGLDNIDLEAATKLGITVVHTPGANTNAVAEHALWAMMHCARNFNKAENALKSGEFSTGGSLPGLVQKLGYATMELQGKTLGLAGMGRIARRLAQMAGVCLNMEVKAFDPLVPENIFDASGVKRCGSLIEMLEGSDFVSLHVPYSPQTHHLIAKNELAAMKSTAYLINTSRGGIVDELALYHALATGIIGGAALDVFEEEPPIIDHPIFQLNNVLVTPHMAAMTDLALVNMATDVSHGIIDVLQNKKPQFLANPEVWGSAQWRLANN